jgi:FSR family fosmidomycin resistance protein-like MFS transporter
LLAAFIVLPQGQKSIAWFGVVALLGIVILWRVSEWGTRARARPNADPEALHLPFSRARTNWALVTLAMLVFSKYIYMASLTSYYTFYTMQKFGVSVQQSQLLLFVFAASRPADGVPAVDESRQIRGRGKDCVTVVTDWKPYAAYFEGSPSVRLSL